MIELIEVLFKPVSICLLFFCRAGTNLSKCSDLYGMSSKSGGGQSKRRDLLLLLLLTAFVVVGNVMKYSFCRDIFVRSS